VRYLTAGESHGPCLTAIIEGMPAGLSITHAQVNRDLQRRQRGYGRGKRMQIEQDKVTITGGVRHGVTLGSPICLQIENHDWENWATIMDPNSNDAVTEGGEKPGEPVTRPRPGHADLAGAQKYMQTDIRNILERASARETAARVAVGAVARALLSACKMNVYSHVVSIGSVSTGIAAGGQNIADIAARAEASELRCADDEAAEAMKQEIDAARDSGDSLGGVFEVIVTGVPPGLGSHVHWDRRLDGRLARAVMSIPAIKGVEIGAGFDVAVKPGSEVHDEIDFDPERGFYRRSNRAGGIEGGISNGEPVVVRAAMKPIPTLYKPLQSVDLVSKQRFWAAVERSDTCAVPAAAVVGEAVVAWEMAAALLEKFGGDHVRELLGSLTAYLRRVDGGVREI